MMDSEVAAQVWRRLISGESLADLGLSQVNGRIDLRGLVAPAPSTVRKFAVGRVDVEERSEVIRIRGARWEGIDFSNGRLDSLRFFDGAIEDCVFDGSRCQDWRMWGMSISNTSFCATDMRRSALGAVYDGRRNSFDRVDFARADLRQTAYKSAEMNGCMFDDANLLKVDFQGSVFVDCVFSGRLKEVLFYRQAFDGESLPPNEMKDVDLRRAKLEFTEFRGLDMSDVRWPDDDEHVVVKDYKSSLDRALSFLTNRTDMASRQLTVLLRSHRKWAGENQRQGVLSKHDLLCAADEQAVQELLHVIRRGEAGDLFGQSQT